ncbi:MULTISPECIES: hypothetical protein [Aeromonas]|uniref:Uncharacterized protein n=1 Tax=Aeromonas veronii TaxID=654 RepID=A0A4V3YZZ0_AERVE|nr:MULTISPECIES: hypothetical protein [Aeromonas]THJ44922.1 hypothetical protein E8Q35_12075 [Aeromonas veronii]
MDVISSAILDEYLNRMGINQALHPIIRPTLQPNPRAVDAVTAIMMINSSLSYQGAIAALWNTFASIGGVLLDPEMEKGVRSLSELYSPSSTGKTQHTSSEVNLQGVSLEPVSKRPEEQVFQPIKEPVSRPLNSFPDHHYDDLEDDNYGDQDAETNNGTSLYPYIPPASIDLHTEMTMRRGLFRVMRNPTKPPALDKTIIHHLSMPIQKYYNVMTMSGSALNTELDLVNYLCVVHWFGRMSEDEFEQMVTKPRIMSMAEFYKPIPPDQLPADCHNIGRIIASLERIKSVVLTFYASAEEAEGRTRATKAMMVNLSGTLKLEDGNIHMSPTRELRGLYRSTTKLLPVNRISLIQLTTQFSRLLAMWIVSQGNQGKLDTDGWRVLNLAPYKAEKILREIHPLPSLDRRYDTSAYDMLTNALKEMQEKGLLRCSLEYANFKKGVPIRLTAKSTVTLLGHRFGHKLTKFEQAQPTQEAIVIEHEPVGMEDVFDLESTPISRKPAREVPTQTAGCDSETAKHFASLMFPRGMDRNYVRWLEDNKKAVAAIVKAVKAAAKISLVAARHELRGVRQQRLTVFARILASTGHPQAALFESIRLQNPQAVGLASKPSKASTSEIESLIREIPCRTTRQSATAWYSLHHTKIMAVRKAIQRDQLMSLKVLGSINRLVYEARLVTPILAASDPGMATWFRSQYEVSRESINDYKRQVKENEAFERRSAKGGK